MAVARPERGEVPFSCELRFDEDDEDALLKSGKFSLTFKMNNAGRRAMEDFLDLEYNEINERIGRLALGSRILTAMFFGATRKHHARKFPTPAHCDQFMDAVYEASEDSEEDIVTDLQIALLAANRRTTIKEMRKVLMLDEDESEESEETEDEDAAPKDEAPPETDEPEKSKSEGRADTGRGKRSSKKPSAAA